MTVFATVPRKRADADDIGNDTVSAGHYGEQPIQVVHSAYRKDKSRKNGPRPSAPELYLVEPEPESFTSTRSNQPAQFTAERTCTVILEWVCPAPRTSLPPTACYVRGRGSDRKTRGSLSNIPPGNRESTGADGTCSNSRSGSAHVIAGNSERNKDRVPTRAYKLARTQTSAISNKIGNCSGRENRGYGPGSVRDSDNGGGRPHNIPTYK